MLEQHQTDLYYLILRKANFSSQKEFTQHFPKSGWVEHNPDEIWKTTIKTLKDVSKSKKLKGKILSRNYKPRRRLQFYGIRNQVSLFIKQSFGKIEDKKNFAKN